VRGKKRRTVIRLRSLTAKPKCKKRPTVIRLRSLTAKPKCKKRRTNEPEVKEALHCNSTPLTNREAEV
jgi:hypothetical protein